MILVQYDFNGSPRVLLDRYDRAREQVIKEARQRGVNVIAHICLARGDDGMRIYDVFESEDDFRCFIDHDDFRAAMVKYGMQQPQVKITPIHRFGW
jgi:hypothetical protein